MSNTIAEIVGADHLLARRGKVLRCELVPAKTTTRVLNSVRVQLEKT